MLQESVAEDLEIFAGAVLQDGEAAGLVIFVFHIGAVDDGHVVADSDAQVGHGGSARVDPAGGIAIGTAGDLCVVRINDVGFHQDQRGARVGDGDAVVTGAGFATDGV